MPSQRAPVQVNQFIGGLNTEANPLSFPLNASSDELNMEIDSDGSRSQREGFDAETSYQEINTGVTNNTEVEAARSQFRWFNPGGNPETQILVVQLGNYLGFHKIGDIALSSETLFSTTLDTDAYSTPFSYAVVDGSLLVATGLSDISVFSYNGTSISEDTTRLKIRDLFGVVSRNSALDILTDPEFFQHRPANNFLRHAYNLRNQTFALPRVSEDNNTTQTDPIVKFASVSSRYPSTADNLNLFYAPIPSHTNGTVDRYLYTDHFKTPPNTNRAPRGYFIIDALDRGTSRGEVLAQLYSDHSSLTQFNGGSPLKTDRTEGGPTAVAQYAGRAWYAGFPAESTDVDKESPRMASYVLFSQVVQGTSNYNLCYQKADPTSPEDPDLVADDGGFLKISGAYNIKGLVALSSSLFVLAENGIWQITGTDQASFTATGYSVSKVSDFGCSYPQAIIEYGSDCFFWGKEGIYRLFLEPTSASYQVQNISDELVKTRFDGITENERKTVVGYYDFRRNSLRWLYGAFFNGGTVAKEFILNLKNQAYTYNEIENEGEVIGPASVSGGFPVVGDGVINITANSVQVTANSENVVLTADEFATIEASSSFYCIVTDTTTTIRYTFGGYQEGTNLDWVNVEGTGFLPDAYIITGPVSGAEGRLRKGVPYLTVYMNNLGVNASCLYSARWGWSQDVSTGRWSSTREAYRPSSHDTNIQMVITRNAIRGHGRAVAFYFSNDGTSPLDLFGWEFNLEANAKE